IGGPIGGGIGGPGGGSYVITSKASRFPGGSAPYRHGTTHPSLPGPAGPVSRRAELNPPRRGLAVLSGELAYNPMGVQPSRRGGGGRLCEMTRNVSTSTMSPGGYWPGDGWLTCCAGTNIVPTISSSRPLRDCSSNGDARG